MSDFAKDTNVPTNDLIRRQAVLEEVHKVMLDFFDLCEDDEESPITYTEEKFLEINKAISNRIKNLPSAEQGWIPVSERLPEGNKPVLVTHHGKYQSFVSVDWVDPYTNEWNGTCNVTAWRPLPEPWKGEDNAEVH